MKINSLHNINNNKSRYFELSAYRVYSELSEISVPPTYRFVRNEEDGNSFQIALLSDYSNEVIYCIHCTVLPKLVLDSKPVIQVSVWRTSVIAHSKVISSLTERIFENYLLNSYNICFQIQESKDFWTRQLGHALERDNHVYRYNFATGDLRIIFDHAEIRNNSADMYAQNILAVVTNEPLSLISAF